MPRKEMLQAGLAWAERELNGWAGEIEMEGEIVGSSEDVAHRLRDIAQSIRTALDLAATAAEPEARRGPKAPDPCSSAIPSMIDFLLRARQQIRGSDPPPGPENGT